MQRVLIILWIHIFIPLMFGITSIAFAQQEPIEGKELQYVETVDLRVLVKTVKELATNVSELTKNQKELTKSVYNISTKMTGIEKGMTGVETRLTNVEKGMTGVETRLTKVETRVAVIEERTAWIRGLLYIVLAAIVGSIVTPITLHILSIRSKQNSDVAEIKELEKDDGDNQN